MSTDYYLLQRKIEKVIQCPGSRGELESKLMELCIRIDQGEPPPEVDKKPVLLLAGTPFYLKRFDLVWMPFFPDYEGLEPGRIMPAGVVSAIVRAVEECDVFIKRLRLKSIPAVYHVSAQWEGDSLITGTLEISRPDADDPSVEIIDHMFPPDSKEMKILEITNFLHENPDYLDHVYREYKVKWSRFLKWITSR